MFRTYAGHSTARESNALYRKNLEKGQTGLSIAFDLPTQTGYDADHELARGEVGKVGVPVAHKGDMHALMDGIPLDRMNTSMTINATAAWLLALYLVVAEENGISANSVCMSSMCPIGTPTLPTSPRASGWSASKPVWVGRSNATERPVCPLARLRRYSSLLARAVEWPAYVRIIHGLSRSGRR